MAEEDNPEPAASTVEAVTLLAFLDQQRATLAWKTRALDAAGLRASVGASTITLGGLLKHLAFVEDYWLSRTLHGHDPAFPWVTGTWNTDSKRSWTPAAEETWEQLHAQWQETVTHSRTMIDAALAKGGMDGLARQPSANGTSPSLRWILVHMIEEYARHNGHADLIRESIDGLVGHAPPGSTQLS